MLIFCSTGPRVLFARFKQNLAIKTKHVGERVRWTDLQGVFDRVEGMTARKDGVVGAVLQGDPCGEGADGY